MPILQEASILALGAIAEGCREEMDATWVSYINESYCVSGVAPESSASQAGCLTIGRYAAVGSRPGSDWCKHNLLAQ
jgi:ribosomal protein S8E